MKIRDAIEKYIGLESIKGVTKIRHGRDISRYLDLEVEDKDIWFWKSGDEETKFAVNLPNSCDGIEYRYGKWSFISGCTPAMDDEED